MRIGFFHDAAGTRHAGGIAVYCQRMAASLARDHDVVLVTERGTPSSVLTDAAVELVQTPTFSDRVPATLERVPWVGRQEYAKVAMIRWARDTGLLDWLDDRVDVLVTSQYLDDLLLSNLLDVPTVYGIHSVRQVGVGARLRNRFTETTVEFANSYDTARRVAESFDTDVEAVIHPGVDPSQFNPRATPVLHSPLPRILFVGRLVRAKGIFDLVEAVASLPVDASLHVVGTGDEEGVRAAAMDRGLYDRTFVHGEVPHNRLPGYYVSADVCCLPTSVESFGQVNLEAMACETPVVTSRLPAIQEYVREGVDGLLVEPGDTGQLTTALATLLARPTMRTEMGRRGRDRAGEFSWDVQAARLATLCQRVCDGQTTATSDTRRGNRIETTTDD